MWVEKFNHIYFGQNVFLEHFVSNSRQKRDMKFHWLCGRLENRKIHLWDYALKS